MSIVSNHITIIPFRLKAIIYLSLSLLIVIMGAVCLFFDFFRHPRCGVWVWALAIRIFFAAFPNQTAAARFERSKNAPARFLFVGLGWECWETSVINSNLSMRTSQSLPLADESRNRVKSGHFSLSAIKLSANASKWEREKKLIFHSSDAAESVHIHWVRAFTWKQRKLSF